MSLCPKCHGTGVFACHRCNGAATVSAASVAGGPGVPVTQNSAPVKCPSCHGVGTEPCRQCDGAGDVDC